MAKMSEDVDLRTLPKDDRPKPTTGQSGPERELPFDELNSDEKLVVRVLNDDGEGTRQSMPVSELSDALIKTEPDEAQGHAKLLVRNAMRRLVQGGWVEWVDRGRYRITEKGRKRLKRKNGES